jgi:hypothetical protein
MSKRRLVITAVLAGQSQSEVARTYGVSQGWVVPWRQPDPRYVGLRTNGRYRALVFMGSWLGPRWNEAIGLRVCDINSTRCAKS